MEKQAINTIPNVLLEKENVLAASQALNGQQELNQPPCDLNLSMAERFSPAAPRTRVLCIQSCPTVLVLQCYEC